MWCLHKSIQLPVFQSQLKEQHSMNRASLIALKHYCLAAGQKQQQASPLLSVGCFMHLQMGAAPNTLLPKQLTTINKHYQAEAVIGLKEVEPRPVRALQYFCNRVQQLCCKHRLQIDFINISTIFTAVAQLWDKAQANQEFHLDQPKTNRKLVAFLRSVFTLVPMPGKVGSQAISNISWASAKLGIDLYTFEPGLTCKLVADFVKSIQASKANNRPNAQGSANFFWALGVWQHLPSDAAFSIMWAHSVALFEDAEQPLKPQDSSNFLYACAQLGLAVTEKDAHILLNSMLNQGRGSPTVQDYGNTAWSLAVLGRLHVESLQALLNQVFHLQETMQHASNCFTDANLRQMYQALYALQPPLDAPCEQQERWEQLQRSLSKLGPCPPWHWSTGKEQLTAALSKMDVCYEVDVLLSAYMAAAVIWPCVRHAPAVIVTINLEEFDYIKNRVNRSGCDTKQLPAPRRTLAACIICLLCQTHGLC